MTITKVIDLSLKMLVDYKWCDSLSLQTLLNYVRRNQFNDKDSGHYREILVIDSEFVIILV